jgi:uncharacterized membrane protein YhaH (DUF805 family)
MNRLEYWKLVGLYMAIVFVVGFMQGYGHDLDGFNALLYVVWHPFAWVIGYQRIKDAGHHGLWAFFTPFVIGLIWLGCLKSADQRLELYHG